MFAQILIGVFKEYLSRASSKYVYFIFFPEIALSIAFAYMSIFVSDEPVYIVSLLFIGYTAFCYFQIRKYTKHSYKQISKNLGKIALCVVPIILIVGKVVFFS